MTTPDGKHLRTLDDTPLDGRRVIVRADFNVSVGSDNVVSSTEDFRIKTALETIQELSLRRCRILLLIHRGRPLDTPADADLSPIHRRLEELLRGEVRTLPALYGSAVEAVVSGMEPGDVALFPNVRLDEREIHANQAFARQMSESADCYVNEAFASSHRDHASISLLPKILPSCAGRRTVREVEVLSNLKNSIKRPYVTIMSGAKIRTKVGMMRYMLSTADTLCVGGRIANILLAAKGVWETDMFDEEELAIARDVLSEGGDRIVIPEDVVVGNEDGSDRRVVLSDQGIHEKAGVWDIGPRSAQRILEVCANVQTIMWNGPVGKFEVDAYGQGTKDIAQGLSSLSSYRVVGGGDTVNALEKLRLTHAFNHVSVGGGAMIAFLEGAAMPGLEPLYVEY